MKFDFDTPIHRRETESVKWRAYDGDVLPMWVADMDFRSAEPIIEALRKRVEHGVFGYPLEEDALREAILAWMEKYYSWKASAEDIIIVPGVVVGFNLATMALATPGGGVMYQTPAYPPFLEVAAHTGTVKVEVPLVHQPDGYYIIDYDAFEESISKGVKMFILCNPQNPTGRVFKREELERIAEICLRHKVAICSDEIHGDLIFTGNKHIPIASLSPEVEQNTVTLFAPSKTFNIAGLKMSVLVASNPEIREKLHKASHGLVEGSNVLALTAGLAAYREARLWLDALLVYLEGNRDYCYAYIQKEMPKIKMGKPEGTYLAWLDCREAIQGNPSQFFLKNARVAVNDGARFGEPGEGFVRLNFGCPRAQLTEALDKMRKAYRERG